MNCHLELSGEKWICHTQLHSSCIWLCTGRGQSAEDVTVTSHYESISKLPSRYSWCNCSTLPVHGGWIVVFLCSHALHSWPSTSCVTEPVIFSSFSFLRCIDGIQFYSSGVSNIPFIKFVFFSAFLYLWCNWSFFKQSIYLLSFQQEQFYGTCFNLKKIKEPAKINAKYA